MKADVTPIRYRVKFNKNTSLISNFRRNMLLYIMLIPVILYFFIFHYIPMLGVVIAFKNYSVVKGFVESPWVGFRNFEYLFTTPEFFMILKNTVLLSMYRIVCGFPAPIILSLLLNEVRSIKFKRVSQTIYYLPHFLSWVVFGGLIQIMFSLHGPAVDIMKSIGMEEVNILTLKGYFRTVLVFTAIWKEVGWGTIVYLATMAGIDQQLYEAAEIDGANHWQQIWHITLPGIKGVATILLILSVGNIMSAGFEQILVLQNPFVREVSEIIDTYVYKRGIQQTQYSFSTAVGLFKGVISLILISGTNYLSKKVGEDGLW